jgi:2-polyprenyl-3-methyl-5-hydroxy-6-metoxy-1,4-benzoquinol methylase
MSKIKNIVKPVYFKLKYNLNIIYSYLFIKNTYAIKKGYIHRKEYSYFDDTTNTDGWQLEVYTKALEYSQKNNYKSVIDYGCGSAYKLIKYFNEFETTGIDVSPTFEFLNKQYPSKKWLRFGDFDMKSLSSDIVICSDVIEHVLNPDELLENINKIDSVNYIFISTPDRNLLQTPKFGPANNKTHIREWSFEELNKYVSNFFEIVEHYISNEKQATQLIIAKKKP